MLADRTELDTTPYEMRLTQMGQNPLVTRQNEPWCWPSGCLSGRCGSGVCRDREVEPDDVNHDGCGWEWSAKRCGKRQRVAAHLHRRATVNSGSHYTSCQGEGSRPHVRQG